MGLRIATNVQSLSAQRSLENNYKAQNAALEKLSSGQRINRAGDDAAGLAISEKLKSTIRSIKQAGRNANDGISLIQTAEGSMSEISNILIRLRELSMQGASDTISDTERGFIEKEVVNLKDEINRISSTTEFNGTYLLDGQTPPLEVQVGMHNDPTKDRLVYESSALTTTLESLGLDGVTVANKEGAQGNMNMIDGAISKLNENRSNLGALQNRLQSTINNLSVYRENIEAANSRIRDTDMAVETSENTKNQILTQANISVLSQANSNSSLALKLLG